MSTVSIDGSGARQSFDDNQLPISLGGASSDVKVPGFSGDGPIAFVGLSDGDFFLQPAPGASSGAAVNGVSLTTSRWLADGDQITLGGVTCGCRLSGGALSLDFAERRADAPSRKAAPTVEGVDSQTLIKPVDFTPRWNAPPPRRRFGVRPGIVVAAVLFAALAAGAWFVLTARTVSIVTDPEAAEVQLSGGIKLTIGSSHLLRPGTYDLSASHPGYVDLQTTVAIDADTPGELRFELQPLGTELSVSSRPVSGATVSIDNQVVGTTPLEGFQLAAGDHTLNAQAPLHLPYAMDLEVEPGEAPLDLVLDLEPNWAPVTIASRPAGATVVIDGSAAGRTPLTAEVESGSRVVELRLSGFKPSGRRITVNTGEPLDLGSIALDPLDGTLVVTSTPEGATVTVDGQFKGTTPIELRVDPDTDMDVRLTLAGHSAYQTEVRVGAGRRTTVDAELEMVTGQVKITSQPPGATVLVDGVERGTTEQVLELAARPHRIELRLDGWVSYTASVTPQPGLLQAVHAELRQEGPAGLPKTITSPQGVELVLVAPARFIMGAPRREPGRRSNEVLREVEITKPFYLAVREVSNREFREFRSGHRSGGHARQNLEIDHHPVVNVTWQDAARYCNWLSEKAGLTPVYVDRGGSLAPRQPMPNGYRLATEAEWALAARFASDADGRKYAWGDSLPVPANGGNYGDGLPDHGDGHPGTAPVGSYQANPLGIYNLGGNVSEWVQDIYTMTPTSPGTVAQDPMGPSSGSAHVIRGSSWLDSSVTELRLSYRDSGSEPRPDVGFRIARSAQ